MVIKHANARRKAEFLLPHLSGCASVLDFGCGDLQLSKELHVALPSVRITGVDVVDFGNRPKGISFRKYDGNTLPFSSASFDAVVAYHVFHHAPHPFALLAECFRVSKHTVLFVEPIYRGWWDIPGMRAMDYVFNIWKSRSIAMPYAFASKNRWELEIVKAGWDCAMVKDVEILPYWLPSGRSLLFDCRKH